MGEENYPFSVRRAKLQQFRNEYSDYIRKNTDRIIANLPVFFGHLASSLDTSLADIPAGAHDQLIDTLAEQILTVSGKNGDPAFIRKVEDHARRVRRAEPGSRTSDILAGFRLVDTGQYAGAIEYLGRYKDTDAVIPPLVAYCYYVLSTHQKKPAEDAHAALPNEMMLASREVMAGFIRQNPPINYLRDTEMIDDNRATDIFWFMLNLAMEWFPKDRAFLRIGIAKARRDRNFDIRENLLKLATERFCDDWQFLREAYRLRLDKRDAAGVAGIIRQMVQQYPNEAEPVYYGLKLSIVTVRSETYARFRKMALARNMPADVLLLLDTTLALALKKPQESFAGLDGIRKAMADQQHYVTLFEYLLHESFSEDERRAKRAKKAIIDSVDYYCMKRLRIPPD